LTRAITLFLLLGILTAAASAKPKRPALAVDSDYVLALATANDFLHAWQTRDPETGLLLLTDGLKQRTAENALANFFTGTSQRQSFEIGRGKKLTGGRYRFPVSLFQKRATDNSKWMHPEPSVLIVVRTGKNDWAIDRLP
jgi:hypothetical protein